MVWIGGAGLSLGGAFPALRGGAFRIAGEYQLLGEIQRYRAGAKPQEVADSHNPANPGRADNRLD
ncbi:hypothetical protein ANRL1_01039 [Anaerolineae bacterium]|nr:hypothetical protein ANRL1_01039 [Anaerolineae bacterium]